LEGGGHGVFEGTALAFGWRDYEKLEKISIRADGKSLEIQSG
jgi:hypothetical protein